MERHYEVLMVEAGHGLLRPSRLGTKERRRAFWRDRVEAQTVSIQKIVDSLPYVFHGETLRGFDGGSRTPPASTIKTGYQREAWRILKGPSRSPNRVNSEDCGQPSIRFPWRNTTRFWWWNQGPASTIKTLGTKERRGAFWRDRVEAQTVSIQKIMDSLPYVFHGETLRGFDGGSRALLPPSKHWVPGSCVTHFEGMASKPTFCQFSHCRGSVYLQTKVDTPDQGVCYKRVLRLFVSLVISAASAVIGQLSKFEWSRTSACTSWTPQRYKKKCSIYFCSILFFPLECISPQKKCSMFFLADELCIKSNPVGSIIYGSGLN